MFTSGCSAHWAPLSLRFLLGPQDRVSKTKVKLLLLLVSSWQKNSVRWKLKEGWLYFQLCLMLSAKLLKEVYSSTSLGSSKWKCLARPVLPASVEWQEVLERASCPLNYSSTGFADAWLSLALILLYVLKTIPCFDTQIWTVTIAVYSALYTTMLAICTLYNRKLLN